MLWHSIILLPLALGAEALSRTYPPPDTKVVAKSAGQYASLQSAINSIDKNSTATTNIFIQPGNYSGQVFITSGYRGKINVYGSTTDDQDYTANQVILSYNASSASAGGNVESATLRIESPNVSFYNVLVENTAGNAGPSHALSAGAPHLGFYGCGFTGYQDTVFVGKPGVVFKNSYLEGAVDFIYGTDANIWFEECDIGFSREKGGYITASGRDRADANWYVFNNSRVFAKSGVAVRAGSVLLGRAWRAFARVLFQNTEMSAIVNPEGWGAWYNTENTTMIYYAEFHNTGPGANTTGRVDWSYQLNESVSIDYTMPDWKTWVDLKYWYYA